MTFSRLEREHGSQERGKHAQALRGEPAPASARRLVCVHGVAHPLHNTTAGPGGVLARGRARGGAAWRECPQAPACTTAREHGGEGACPRRWLAPPAPPPLGRPVAPGAPAPRGEPPFPLDTREAPATMPRVTASSASPCALATSAPSVPITPTGPSQSLSLVPVPCPCGGQGRTRKESGMRHPPALPTFTPPRPPGWPALGTPAGARLSLWPPVVHRQPELPPALPRITPSCAPSRGGCGGRFSGSGGCPSPASPSCWPWGSSPCRRPRSRWATPVRWWTPSGGQHVTRRRAGVRRAVGRTHCVAPGSTQTLTEVHNSTYGPTGLPVMSSVITIAGQGSTIVRDSGAPYFRILAVSSTGESDAPRDHGEWGSPL